MAECTELVVDWVEDMSFSLIDGEGHGFNVYITGKHKASPEEIAKWMCDRINWDTTDPMPA